MSAPSRPLEGHLALITGSTGVIGRATAHALAAQGCSLALHFHSNASLASSLSQSLSAAHSIPAIIHKADLSNPSAAQDLFNDVVTAHGRAPSILFANAGSTDGLSGVSKIEDVSDEAFQRTWQVNCGSVFALVRACVPRMQEEGWGRVIVCSSVAALTGGLVGPHYSSSKSALHGLVHWVSNMYSSRGITANAIAPALIADTAMLPGAPAELAKKIPVGRLGTPDEIAATVVWMVNCGYVTNKIVPVDGGMVAR